MGLQEHTVTPVRVYELAKEFGMDSKTVMTELKSIGVFLHTASSTVDHRRV
jgi:translation initiation factor IF-2